MDVDALGPARRSPASLLQAQWWSSTASHISNDNVVVAFTACGPVDGGALHEALRQLVVRHEILRTRFATQGHEVQQVVTAPVEPDVWRVDLSHTARPDVELERMLLTDVARPFHLASRQLWRPSIVRMDDQRTTLALVIHHSLWDGWSTLVALRDLARLYASVLTRRPPRLAEMPSQFADYAAWERLPMTPESAMYWRERLSPLPTRPALPLAPHWKDGTPYEVGWFPIPPLSAQVGARLSQIAHDQGTSMTSVIHAAVAMTLADHVAADLVIGMQHANRRRPEHKSLIGPVFDFLPLRVPLNDNPTFLQMLARVEAEKRQARAHMNPFRRIERAFPTTDRPILDVSVNVIPERSTSPQRLTLPDGQLLELAHHPVPVDWLRVKVEREYYAAGLLAYVVRHGEHGLTGSICANATAMPVPVMASVAQAFTTALALVSQDPHRRASDLARDA